MAYAKQPKTIKVKAIWIAIIWSMVICNISFAITFIKVNVIQQGEPLELSNPQVVPLGILAFLGISLWHPLVGVSALCYGFVVMFMADNIPQVTSRKFWLTSLGALAFLTFSLAYFLSTNFGGQTLLLYLIDLGVYLMCVGTIRVIIRIIGFYFLSNKARV
jgi:hypothetical protein